MSQETVVGHKHNTPLQFAYIKDLKNQQHAFYRLKFHMYIRSKKVTTVSKLTTFNL